MLRPKLKRVVPPIAAVLAAALVSWAAPLFHVVPLTASQRMKADHKFDPDEAAADFWENQLLPALPSAVDATTVLAAIRSDFAAARQKYGHTNGVGSSFCVFLQGTGRVVEVTARGVVLTLSDDSSDADVLLPLGMIFGSTVRDATGLLDVSDFPNSQDFNAIAASLNGLVEARVLPELQKAKVGDRLTFTGCAQVASAPKPHEPLKVIPVRITFQESK